MDTLMWYVVLSEKKTKATMRDNVNYIELDVDELQYHCEGRFQCWLTLKSLVY